MRNSTLKRITKIILIVTLLTTGIGVNHPIHAEDRQGNEDGEEQLGNFKEEGKSYYHLDAVPEDFAKDEGFMDNIKSNLWFLDSNEISQKMSEMFNYLANIAFDMNILMTNFMLSSLDFAYEFNFINTIIEKLDDIVGGITGISGNGHITSSGIFGNLAIFAAVFAVIYAAFLMLWKRSMFASLGTIIQTTLALTVAILLFTNYSPFLTGLNQITTQASSLVLAGNSQDVDDGAQPSTTSRLDEESLKDGMKDNIWGLFIDRPYLYMMYGETDLNSLADSKSEAVNRVNNILKEQPNSEERYSAISNELEVHQNEHLLYDNIRSRLSFTVMYLGINGVVSIPIYLLSIALLVFQFWFMLIAIFAPFALLFGAIPGQFNVVKRYFIELGLPLVLKIVVSFTALVIFAISDLLYEADFVVADNNGPVEAYTAAALIHFVLLILIFLLRNRIRNIFSAGSQGVQELREGMGSLTNPLKKGVQGTSTAAGAAVGAVATGGAGAIAGANVGGAIGRAATGEGNVGDIAKSGMHAHRSHQMASLRKLPSDNASLKNIKESDSSSQNELMKEKVNRDNRGSEEQYPRLRPMDGMRSQRKSEHLSVQKPPISNDSVEDTPDMYADEANYIPSTPTVDPAQSEVLNDDSYKVSEWMEETPDLYRENVTSPITGSAEMEGSTREGGISEREIESSSVPPMEEQRHIASTDSVEIPAGTSIQPKETKPSMKEPPELDTTNLNRHRNQVKERDTDSANMISLEKSMPPQEKEDDYPTLD
ncbi:CD3337/EF1877 family mobilome membrane protein [Virgibacillus sediminis]|uniref:CD3337/EF1877 family mobilome membrane protein n=1 Tax=Virgibacillus sediminis TaxID=202260 RepID=A0ABV7A3Q8_9BACI